MITFLDFETDGLPNRSRMRELDCPDHPHIASAAMISYSDDLQHEVGSLYFKVKPNNWLMPEETARINGLSQGVLETYGIGIKTILNAIDAYVFRSQMVITFNMKFDGFMYDLEVFRLNRQNYMPENKRFCAMLACAELMSTPNQYGELKWPSLADAYRHFLGKEMVGAHHGLWDVYNLKELTYHLLANRLWNPIPQP